MNRLILCGSPRVNGRSAKLADEIFWACIEDCPDDEVKILSVASLDIRGCIGCDACRKPREGTTSLAEPAPLDEPFVSPCSINDDMAEAYAALTRADELIVVCPVYFAGAPAQMKAVLDRLQAFYWTDVRKQPKRPAVLHIVGEGGDPHGWDPLVVNARSALAVAGFKLGAIMDWVGCIDRDGEIIADAAQYVIEGNEIVACSEFAVEDEDSDAEGYEDWDSVVDMAPSEPVTETAEPKQEKKQAKSKQAGGKQAGGKQAQQKQSGKKQTHTPQAQQKQSGKKQNHSQQGSNKQSKPSQGGKKQRNTQAQQSAKRAGARANKGGRRG